MSDEIEDTEGKSKWAPGEMADGTIPVLTPDEAAKLIGERNADEEAFNALLGEDEPDLSTVDLESMPVEELDQLIEGLDASADAD